MKNFATSLQRFLASDEGPTAVEYAVMLAMIITVCMTAIQGLGANVFSKFDRAGDALR
jgi:pilus assembly protein Flp/PilA